MTIEVEVLRVFTDERGERGNELGVIASDPATAGGEQAIAARLGFSETVFVDGIEGEVARARIFTPAEELPFAGHPTVGLAWHLRDRGHPVTTLHVPAGPIAATVEGDDVFVAARPEWAPDFDFIELDSPAEVEALDPDAVPNAHHYYWAWADERSGALRSRMFGRRMGIREDQARARRRSRSRHGSDAISTSPRARAAASRPAVSGSSPRSAAGRSATESSDWTEPVDARPRTKAPTSATRRSVAPAWSATASAASPHRCA